MARASDTIGPLLIAGGLAAGGFLLAMGAWAGTLKVSSAVIARGHTIAEGDRKPVQSNDSAPVKSVFVKEGDRVVIGQPLIELDLSDIRGEAMAYEATLRQLEARQARLSAEQLETKLTFSADLLAVAAKNLQVQSFIRQETTLFEARRIAHEGAKALVDQKIRSAIDRASGLNASLKAIRDQLSYIVEEKTSIATLVEKGIVSRSQHLALEREGARLQAEIEGLLTDIAASHNELQSAEVEKNQLDTLRRETIANELAELEAMMSTIVPRLTAANERLDRSLITSPETGYVYSLNVLSNGATVLPGQTLLEIVPSDQPIVLRTEVSPNDIDRVEPGQTAQIYLAPYSSQLHVVIDGLVQRVSPDMMTDSRTGRSYYTATIGMNLSQMEHLNAKVIPGMSGEAIILGRDRTIMAYLLAPLARAYDFALREY